MVGGSAQREVGGGRLGVYSTPAPEALPGLSSRVATASSVYWCLASYNLQNAHPFAEVSRMRGGGGVEWKARGMISYSDTYRNGGLRCLIDPFRADVIVASQRNKTKAELEGNE